MPPLKSMLKKSLDGFAPVESPVLPSAPPLISERVPGPNPYRRCPLPPLSSSPDSLRQFDESGTIPARRIIPLPAQVAGQGGTTVTNTTVIGQSGGGSSSGGGSKSTSLISATVGLQIAALAPGQIFKTSVQMSKSFQLLQITTNKPVEVRLYSNSIAQSSDSVRPTDTPPPFEVSSGIITDVVFDTSPYTWSWQNRVGANADSVPTPTIYVTIVNSSGANLNSVGLTITYLPLES